MWFEHPFFNVPIVSIKIFFQLSMCIAANNISSGLNSIFSIFLRRVTIYNKCAVAKILKSGSEGNPLPISVVVKPTNCFTEPLKSANSGSVATAIVIRYAHSFLCFTFNRKTKTVRTQPFFARLRLTDFISLL